MNNADFWTSIHDIIAGGFSSEGLKTLDSYAEQFITGRLVYKRFSPQEQYGCATGGSTNVVATLLAGAEAGADSSDKSAILDFQEELKLAASQESVIETWSRRVGLWSDSVEQMLTKHLGERIAEGGEAEVYDHGATLVKSIGLDYFIQPIFALDRISLHNTYFPETRLHVLGFGRNSRGEFKIIVEQPFIDGCHMNDDDIACYMRKMGFKLHNPTNWTYVTPDIYLSDMHDENVLRSLKSDTIFVVDCDIRINTPQLRHGGKRRLTTEVQID